jgi:GT2 family glycosyltransferase
MPNATAETNQMREAQPAKATELPQLVLLICVKYGSDAETTRYLDSLRELQGQRNLHVILVDNTLGARWSEPATEHNLTVVRSEENLGYFGGARSGLSLYLREHPLPDWVIVSNVDLLIADSQFLDKLAALRGRPRVGIVAPSIRSALTGRNQNPFMRTRPSAARMHAYKWMFRSWLLLNAYELASAVFHKLRSAANKRPDASADLRENLGGTIYAPHGSFLIFSREYFHAGGNLDFPCFLFGEEVYLAETLRTLGLDVLYEPSLQVVHQEHGSTKLVKSRKLARAVASSAAYCADTYFPLK